MGYTHYFPQRKVIDAAEWDEFTQDVRKILDNVIRVQGIVLESNDSKDGLLVNEHRINFNGDSLKDLDHETFYLSKWEPTFNFCKTAQKPYDLAVCAVLLLADKRLPDYFEISSDGDAEDWKEAKALVETIFEEVFELPQRVRGD